MAIERKYRILLTGVAVAAVLWFVMFSPWTAPYLNFWLAMSMSALVLTSFALVGLKDDVIFPDVPGPDFKYWLGQIVLGVIIAWALWGIFWIGDKLSKLMFDFAGGQIDSIYGMKDGSQVAMIAALLLLVIGPAEEFFWRGFVQRRVTEWFLRRSDGKWDGVLGKKWTSDKALILSTFCYMVLTAVVYALVHLWSFNFMLIMAALVAGGVWGLLYWIRPTWLPALIISHALWDALVFVILPI